MVTKSALSDAASSVADELNQNPEGNPAVDEVYECKNNTVCDTADACESEQPAAAEPMQESDAECVDGESEMEAVESDKEVEAEAEEYAARTKEELLELLERALAEESVVELRRKAEAVKVAFYKLHRAEVEAARKAFAEAEGEEAEFVPAHDEGEQRLKELLREYRRRRDEYAADMDKVREENYRTKLSIIEELKELVGTDETVGHTFAKFRELQQRWKETGAVAQQYTKDLWETYNLHVENFYNFVKINKELRDLDLKRNLETKEALCASAEALADEKSVPEAFRKLQKLHEEWHETGPVAREYKEQLWERFKAASTVVNKRHQEYFDMLKEEQKHNLELKTALCEEVESILVSMPSSLKSWNKASERLQDVQTRWRQIGFAPRKDNNKVYERFRAACDRFFERKREFYAGVREEMSRNLELKTKICEAAEALRESEEWKTTTDKLIALQAEWKKIGAVSRRHSDAVWKRFRAACDDFFERKAKHFASVESEYAENLARKTALIGEMLAADIEKGGYELVKEFQRRWSEIGYVPMKAKTALQKQYKEAVDKMFRTLRNSEQGGSMHRFREKVSSMVAAGDRRLSSERERLYNRVRRLEQDIATLENNVGFFSKSKGADKLIADVREKIERAKRELADTIEKVKLIDESSEQ